MTSTKQAPPRRRSPRKPPPLPVELSGEGQDEEVPPATPEYTPYGPGGMQPPPSYDMAGAQAKQWDEWLKGEIERERIWRRGQRDWYEFQKYETDLFRTTLDKAAKTYTLVTRMSVTLFILGVSLFACAALYPLFGGSAAVYPAIFGGLGTATFVTMFILKPFDKAQTALSNLLQAEVCFMSNFELTRQWSRYAELNPANLKLSTATVKRLTRDSVALLERYLEPSSNGAEKDGDSKEEGTKQKNDTN